MSRDSSRNYLHLHASHHADLFEDFTSTLTSSAQTNSTSSAGVSSPTGASTAQPAQPSGWSATFPGANPAMVDTAPGNTHHLPSEDIYVAPQHQPVNPEDEDDIVPDQHAAFGITRAMSARGGRERQWRDFEGLGDAVRGVNLNGDDANNGPSPAARAAMGSRLR